MLSLQRKYELILEAEASFARSVADAVFEKPAISLWMVLVPIFFVFFAFDMKKYKDGRSKFHQEYMLSRHKSLKLATEAVTHDTQARIDDWVRQAAIPAAIEPPYRQWLHEMITYFTALLRADGDDFKGLVRAAYRDKASYTTALNNLSAAEMGFTEACRPQLADTPGAMEVIDAMEKRSRALRRDLAAAVFDHPEST